ncbi:hypothetical protein ES288_D10G275600v1 [Gossypium darwinii]|uniref:Uncharacterized protein n=1 Tax=Gossypium darwinii TaxID=34276 RepID=A0A5D2B2Q7_GOSDA|nr:hypothetical protein ES288_D10G275600v1 [Gossypium darwinii]
MATAAKDRLGARKPPLPVFRYKPEYMGFPSLKSKRKVLNLPFFRFRSGDSAGLWSQLAADFAILVQHGWRHRHRAWCALRAHMGQLRRKREGTLGFLKILSFLGLSGPRVVGLGLLGNVFGLHLHLFWVFRPRSKLTCYKPYID